MPVAPQTTQTKAAATPATTNTKPLSDAPTIPNAPPWMTQLFNMFFGPQGSMEQMLSQLMSTLNQNNQSGADRQLAGLQQQKIGLGRKGIGIEKGAERRQLPLMKRLYELQLKGLGRQEATDKYAAARRQQELRGQSAARGAMTTPGERRREGDIAHQLSDQLGGIGDERRRDSLQYKESVAQVKDALKQLGLKGAELDVSSREIAARLNQALQQNNLSQFMGVNDLFNMINSNNLQQSQLAGGIVSMLLTSGG